MCGIVGRFDREGSGRTPEAELVQATSALHHRGPDAGGWWSEGPFFLGHRRLSIIDLGTGDQPMPSGDGRFVVTFNGEIYNYVELREELESLAHRFYTSSDTEVILEGYREWGAGLPTRLRGMFAFGIVDRSAQTLFLARDRFGEKPLFVHERNGVVSFASELKALAELPDVERAVDWEGLSGFLCLNYVPGDRTLLSGVRRLEPATWRRYGRESVQNGRYWEGEFEASSPGGSTGEGRLRDLQSRLDGAVRIALRSDVPVTVFLSGGVDSSVVSESAARQGHLKHAYCLDFAETAFSEADKASFVARRLGLELRRVELRPAALEDFLRLVEHADDPLADSSAVAVFALAREVARDYKVAISGDGGDELFGGYLTYKATAYLGLLNRIVPRRARSYLAALAPRIPVRPGKVSATYKLMRFVRAFDLPPCEAHFTWNGTWLPNRAATLATDAAAKLAATALTRLTAAHALPEFPRLDQLQAADTREYLPNDILAKVDRMTMAHGLEARAPLLDPNVAGWALALPDREKAGLLGRSKRLLRRLAARHFGAVIGGAAKQGFSIPVHEWLRGPARDLLEDLLSPASVREMGVLNVGAVGEATKRHLDGAEDLGFELWGLMVLLAWNRTLLNRPRGKREAYPMKRVTVGGGVSV